MIQSSVLGGNLGIVMQRNTPNYEFLTVQPVFTQNIPIESAQVKNSELLKNGPNFILGEQPVKFNDKFTL
jgi:hypothetical protein